MLLIFAIAFGVLAFAALRAFGQKWRGVVVGVFMFSSIYFGIPLGYRWFYVERPRQAHLQSVRAGVSSTVSSAGGWMALERECDELIKRASSSDAPTGQVHDLPADLPLLRTINPQRVSMQPVPDGGRCVVLTVSGRKSTGGRGIPFYLLIVGSTNVSKTELGLEVKARSIAARVWEAY